jgi:hypothetical protein
MQIGMPQANALKSIGYTDTILFLTIGKPDIYQYKSVGKSATFFIGATKNLPKLATDLPNLLCEDIWLTNIRRLHIYRITNSREEYCTVSVYPTDFRCICKRHSYLHRK